MNELEMRRALNRVKKFVAVKDYANAKATLRKIEHPKRAQWLAQIESAERQAFETSRPKPWNPSTLFIIAVTGSPILGGLAFAWNWRGFGKGLWGLWTALIQIGLLALAIGAGYFTFMVLPTSDFDSNLAPLLIFPFAFVVGLNIGFPFFIGSRQAAAYKLLEQKGHAAMLAFDYQWGRNSLLAFGLLLLIATGMTGYQYYENLPQNFEDEKLTLTYPGDWSQESVENMPRCQEEGGCHLYIWNNGIEILIQSHESEWDLGTSDELGEWFWDNNLLGDERLIPSAHGSYQIAGLDAHYLSYANQSGFFYKDMVISLGNSYIYIIISSHSKENMDNNWDEIEAILNSIDVKN